MLCARSWARAATSSIASVPASQHAGHSAASLARTMTTLRAFVDDHRNCEDIGMSFMVANVTHAPPMWVKGSYQDYGQWFGSSGGISSGSTHQDTRDLCIDTFTRLFGRMPLVTGHHKSIPAKSAWLW